MFADALFPSLAVRFISCGVKPYIVLASASISCGSAVPYPSGRMQTMSLMMRFCALGVLMIPPFQYICAEAPPSRL